MERIFASAEPLDRHAELIHTCDDRYAAPVVERILPDGAVRLIFNLGDRPSGERGAELMCSAVGATCEPTLIVLAGAVEQLCVTLPVMTAAAVLGVPAGELTDHGVELAALWGRAADETLERLHALPRGARRVAHLARVLHDRVCRHEAPPPAVLAAVRRIAACAGGIRVRALAAQLGLGERRLQQLFHEHVGLTPKAMCRLARFRAVVASRLRETGRSWVEVALDGGFYDQAHLIHELRAFTGLSPGELQRRADDFAFLQDPAARHA